MGNVAQDLIHLAKSREVVSDEIHDAFNYTTGHPATSASLETGHLHNRHLHRRPATRNEVNSLSEIAWSSDNRSNQKYYW